MGRYLSCAVATSMVVEKKNDKPIEKEELNKLKQSVGKIFDLDLYIVKEEENLISLEIKKDVFNENIHDLCRELNKSFFLLHFTLYDDEYWGEDKPDEEWPISITEIPNSNKYMLELGENGNIDFKSKDLSWRGFSPLLRREIPNWRDYNFYIEGIMLFFDVDKVDFEDQTEIVCLLNWFKKDYFKTKLSGSIVFHITD